MEYNEIYEKIRENDIYGFLSGYYYKLDKEELRDIAKELFYNYIYTNNKFDTEDFIKKLKEIWEKN